MPIAGLPGVEIFYLDEKVSEQFDGEIADIPANIPVVLLHGFASSIADNWVNTRWVKFLNDNGHRVIALDHRGHGSSEKFYRESDYTLEKMAADVVNLLDFLDIPVAYVIGYSMGARIGAMAMMRHNARFERLVLGGNGYGMIEENGDWGLVRDGLLAGSMDEVVDLRARAFRRFAERTRSDRKALAACVMGLRQKFTAEEFAAITSPVLIAIGSEDDIAGSGEMLAELMENARFFSIEGRDHMRATGDKTFKQEVATFLRQPTKDG